MNRLLDQAATDLEKAVALDPHVTPAYTAMIDASGFGSDTSYAAKAAKRGLAIDPSSYAIYGQLMWLAQPKWGGSIDAMRAVSAQAQQLVGRNPLLGLLQPEAGIVEANLCHCDGPADVGAYRKVLDQVASSTRLANVGSGAESSDQPGLAVVYLSEALRFDPNLLDERMIRANDLTILGETSWALVEANHLVALVPKNKRSFNARGFAHEAMQDFAHAEQDFLAPLELEPRDEWTLTELGNLYVHRTRAWDKGWDIADRLMRFHPENPNGWALRASIQKDQPRPGLQDTIQYFLAHFGDDPSLQDVVKQMRASLVKEKQHG